MWRAPIGTPWFLPALLAVWGPLGVSLFRPAAPPPAREVVEQAVAVALEEAAKVRPSACVPEAAADPAPPALPAPLAPCTPCPAESCTLRKVALEWSLELPDVSWLVLIVVSLATRALESCTRYCWGSFRRDGGGRRRVALPAIAHS